ncbi:hypothetical protein CR513_14834, partial [Mucuna pruriens]
MARSRGYRLSRSLINLGGTLQLLWQLSWEVNPHAIQNFTFFVSRSSIGNNQLYESDPMENNNRTLKKMAMPDVLYQPWCIQYP